MSFKKKAIVLLSGGLDSTTVMAMARQDGYEIYTLSVYYGQRHALELEAAKKVAKAFNARQHMLIDISLDKVGGSALTNKKEVPQFVNGQEIRKGIPETYVPARNTIFLSCALAWAEVLEVSDIFIGVNAIDYSGYPDCRPEYIEAFERMANLATKVGIEGKIKIKIRTPLIHMTKAEIIQEGIKLGVDYSMTHSCYNPLPQGLACGNCESCLFRKKGFKEACIPDPTEY
ncbi:MAG: 7-cyano-7-deazaguanine synthase QueC [Thermodesulfobacteriota bacterium]|nr:7-cyano-7-deazaguanine synthase QueC [Thermodesulfobacteriota bacterium]